APLLGASPSESTYHSPRRGKECFFFPLCTQSNISGRRDRKRANCRTTESERFMCSHTRWNSRSMSVGDEGFERPPDVRADDEIGQIVEIGRVAVENDKACPAALSQKWNPRCRPHHKRRADRQKQIAGAGKRFGATHGRLRHRLAKRDRRCFDVAAANVAVRHSAPGV